MRDIIQDPNKWYILAIYGLAIFYLAEAIVDIFKSIAIRKEPYHLGFKYWPFGRIEYLTNNTLIHIFDFKPLNCQFCMSGWLAIGFYMFNTQLEYLVPFVAAGIAVILWKIKERLETIVI